MNSYSPPWAPHVVGTYPDRQHEEGDDGRMQLVPMRIVMQCSACGATHQHVCNTGAVHQWIQRFALVHLHRDPLKGKL